MGAFLYVASRILALASVVSAGWWLTTGEGWWTPIEEPYATEAMRAILLALAHVFAILLPLGLTEKTK